jgi:hypothetical protein
MAWRSSFGAIVLLALVALHPSTAVPLRSMLKMMLGSAGMMTGEKTLKTMEPSFSSEMYKLFREGDTRCSGKFFELVKDWRDLVIESSCQVRKSLASGISDAIERWRETCYTHLEKKIQSELDATSKSTREHFELFVEQDRRECTPEGQPYSECQLCDKSIYVVGKLRRLIGSAKDSDVAELRAAERFVSACKELAASDSIKRTNYEEWTPLSTEPYFAHIRFYDFCRRLLDLDLSVQNIDNREDRTAFARRFSEKLDKIQAQSPSSVNPEGLLSETAKSGRERERSVAEAVLRVAGLNPNRILQDDDMKYTLKGTLNRLRLECSRVLDQVDNLAWMHQHMYDLLGRKREDKGAPYAEQNLRYSDACKQLGELKDEEIIKATDRQEETPLPVIEKRKPNKLFAKFKT